MTAKQSGIVLLLCGLAQSCQCQKVPSAKVTAPTDTGWVSGSVAVAVTDAKQFRSIDLPGVTVQLRRATDEQLVASAVTDRAGSYVIGPQPSGRYQLCWEAPGFVAGCSNQLVDIRGTIFYPPTLELTPPGRALFGRVMQRDGRLCNYRDRAFDVDAHAQVTVLNAAEEPVAPSVDANSDGEYVVAGVPLGHLSVRTTCELSSATVVAQTTGVEHTKLDLMLPNSSPEI